MSVNYITALDHRTAPITANTVMDGSGTELRLLCDSSGRLQVAPNNIDAGNFASGQLLPTALSVLYGYDSVNDYNQRIAVNSSGQLSTLTTIIGQVTAVDNGTLTSDQTIPLNMNVLYGYDSSNSRNQRIAVNSSGLVEVYTP